MTFAEFGRLETQVLREIEKMTAAERALNPVTFDDTVKLINDLLDRVNIVRSASGLMEIRAKVDSTKREPDSLSSGEAELICLAIDILSFSHYAKHPDNAALRGVLLWDEPDVHLHPDLQQKLMNLVVKALHGSTATVIIATHSTAILGGLGDVEPHVAFMQRDQAELVFKPASKTLQNVLPVFGAHPLSNVFNQSPILLLEGESDVRIWQQAVRSSAGRIQLWPCAAGSKQQLNEHETLCSEIIGSVYDDAKAHSLRDRDDQPYEIDDIGPVIRMRLACRTAENLLLSDEVLQRLGVTWQALQLSIGSWLEAPSNANHQAFAEMQAFAAAPNRQTHPVKPIRNQLIALTPYRGAWEVAIGQTIATLGPQSETGDGSLLSFLGPKAATNLLGIADWTAAAPEPAIAQAVAGA